MHTPHPQHTCTQVKTGSCRPVLNPGLAVGGPDVGGGGRNLCAPAPTQDRAPSLARPLSGEKKWKLSHPHCTSPLTWPSPGWLSGPQVGFGVLLLTRWFPAGLSPSQPSQKAAPEVWCDLWCFLVTLGLVWRAELRCRRGNGIRGGWTGAAILGGEEEELSSELGLGAVSPEPRPGCSTCEL